MIKVTLVANPAIIHHKRHNQGIPSQQKAARAMPAVDGRTLLLPSFDSHGTIEVIRDLRT
jgi:hypothetical protein